VSGLREGREAHRLALALALGRTPGVGRARLNRLLAQEGPSGLDVSPAEASASAAESLFPAEGIEGRYALERERVAHFAEEGIRWAWRGEHPYPSSLARLESPPALLFWKGTAPCGSAVAVVGTRNPSARGLAEARGLGGALARSGVTVLNGLAAGVDQAALESALAAGGRCEAVLACGVAAPLSGWSDRLALRLLERGGSLISEYHPDAPANKGSFIARDRIQAALSRRVAVVEAHVEGGTMHTALAAVGMGIPVFVPADPGPESEVTLGLRTLLEAGRARTYGSAAELALP